MSARHKALVRFLRASSLQEALLREYQSQRVTGLCLNCEDEFTRSY
ncbi:hypothetical protein SAMN04488005_2225 [Yoonia tamlensis]|uniref:Uncharacterized protein n=1 Tax=Yoonia tamlensis TaxID=390270 RepID=A0A1I6GVW5_9RHOB|nr:hypothetical protein SAMN04488005_2225 [Yoonia tamlensis]